MSDLSAMAWAESLFNGSTIFAALKNGEKFKFPNSRGIYTKTGRDWYKTENGMRWRTSTRAAVIPVGTTTHA